MNDYTRELEIMRRAAGVAGEAVMAYFRLGGPPSASAEIRFKGVDNPLTQADLEADRIIRQHVAAAFPDDGWLSEESLDDPIRLSKERVWVVDPIDGTKEFIQGVPEFALSIALVAGDRVVAGCVYAPAAQDGRGDYIAGSRGGGVWFNGHPARVSDRDELSNALALASRSEVARGEWEPFRGEFRVADCGSIALKLARVAVGRGDLAFTLLPKNEWDVAAGVLLIEEAGGRVSGKEGTPFRFNQPQGEFPGVIASNGRLHEALLKRLAQEPYRRYRS
ncbi:MAG: 3'(2'),5'-bisphosphate nucleotidase CysQ [Magnetococcales bacterium]|nr:3'(2'),5'-bisphosphate nucleotidase CysQ [Magnetococcales bacterium]